MSAERFNAIYAGSVDEPLVVAVTKLGAPVDLTGATATATIVPTGGGVPIGPVISHSGTPGVAGLLVFPLTAAHVVAGAREVIVEMDLDGAGKLAFAVFDWAVKAVPATS